jgi:transposase
VEKMVTILTLPHKFYLEQQHRVERDSRVSDRIKAVLLANDGWTQKQIAQALRVHETTIWSHLNDYSYERNLYSNGGGSSSKLDETQTQEIIAHLEKNTYPSTKEIIAYVESKYGVSYTQQGMYDWLTDHKFSYKKPKGIPAKCDEQRQEAFITKYEELKSNLKPREIIVFIDSVHPTSATKITYGWIKTGVEKLIATTAGHGRMNLTGAINLKTMSILTREYETINGSSTVDFLRAIEVANPTATKIHIIADGGKAHTAKEVQLFLSESNAVNRLYLEETYAIELPSNSVKLAKKIITQLHEVLSKEPSLFKDSSILNMDNLSAKSLLSALRDVPPHPKIIMHPLPPYSPNLNPIERVWKVVNERVRNNVVFKTCAEFKTKIHEFYNLTWDTISSELRDRINDNFQRVKPVI